LHFNSNPFTSFTSKVLPLEAAEGAGAALRSFVWVADSEFSLGPAEAEARGEAAKCAAVKVKETTTARSAAFCLIISFHVL
jgi:hypothetical protein